jgi:hypothetical protein
VLLLFALGFIPNGVSTAPPTQELSYLPPKLYQARTTAVKIWREPKAIHDTGLLRVTKVIAGPQQPIRLGVQVSLWLMP